MSAIYALVGYDLETEAAAFERLISRDLALRLCEGIEEDYGCYPISAEQARDIDDAAPAIYAYFIEPFRAAS